jgi:hypothetical protein
MLSKCRCKFSQPAGVVAVEAHPGPVLAQGVAASPQLSPNRLRPPACSDRCA